MSDPLTIPQTPAASGVNPNDLLWVWQNGALKSATASQVTAVAPLAMNFGQILIGQGTSLPAAVETVSGDATLTSSGALTIAANAITNAKFRQGAGLSIVGVTGAATANVADIAGTANQFLGVNAAGTALLFETMGGDATLSGGTLTLGNNVVTNAKAAQMSALTLKGNNTGSTANATDLTGDLAANMLLFTQAGTGAAQRSLVTKTQERISPFDFGAKGDCVSITSNVSSNSGSNALTISSGTFTQADVGKLILVTGAGIQNAMGALCGTISTVISPTQITISTNAGNTLIASSQTVQYGTDDTAALQAAINYVATLSHRKTISGLQGNFTQLSCHGGNFAISTSVSLNNISNIIVCGGCFTTIGTGWSSANYAFTMNGTTGASNGHTRMRDVTIDCNYLTNGLSVSNTQNCAFLASAIVHFGNGCSGINFIGGTNFGFMLIDPHIAQWNADDGLADNVSFRTGDCIQNNGTTDTKVVGGYIALANRCFHDVTAGANVLFIGTHFVGSVANTGTILSDLVLIEDGQNACRFLGCYFDTGFVHLKGSAPHIFWSCHFYRNPTKAPAGLTAYFNWEATAASQPITTVIKDPYFFYNTFPQGLFTETGGNSYLASNKGELATAGVDTEISPNQSDLLVMSGAATVQKYISTTTSAQVAFADSGTTLAVNIGSNGNNLLLAANGATRLTLSSGAQIGSPTGGDKGAGTLNLASSLFINNAALLTGQATGYGTPTGGSHQTSFAAGSITLANLAAAVAQLIVDLKAGQMPAA